MPPDDPPAGGAPRTGRSTVREPAAGAGFDALVAAHSRARPREPRHRGRDSRTLTAADRQCAPRDSWSCPASARSAAATPSARRRPAARSDRPHRRGERRAVDPGRGRHDGARSRARRAGAAAASSKTRSRRACAGSSAARRCTRSPRVRGDGDRPRCLLPRAASGSPPRARRGADLLAATSDAALAERHASATISRTATSSARLLQAGGGRRRLSRKLRRRSRRRCAARSTAATFARLAGLEEKLMQTLREVGEAERTLEAQGEAAHAELTRLLFWIPAPPVTQTLSRFRPRWRGRSRLRITRPPRSRSGSSRAVLSGQRPRCSLRPSSTPRAVDRGKRSCRSRPPPSPMRAIASATRSRRSRSPSPSRCPARRCCGPWRCCSGTARRPGVRACARRRSRWRSPGSSSHLRRFGCSTAAGWRSATSAGTRRWPPSRCASCADSWCSSCR